MYVSFIFPCIVWHAKWPFRLREYLERVIWGEVSKQQQKSNDTLTFGTMKY